MIKKERKHSLFLSLLFIVAFFYFLPNAIALIYPASHVRVVYLNCEPTENNSCEIEGKIRRDWMNMQWWTLETNDGRAFFFPDKTLGENWVIHNLEVQK